MARSANGSHDLDTENAILRRELARYRTIVDQLTTGVYVYDLEDRDDDHTLRMLHANPAVEVLTGVPTSDQIGKTLDENFPGLREQGIPQAYANVVLSGEPMEAESVYGDERVITAAFMIRAVPLPGNEVAVFFDNITARKQTELALKQLNAELEERVTERTMELERSQILLRHVLDSSPSAIYIKNLEGRFLLVNQRTAAIMGQSANELVNRADYELFPEEFVAQWRSAEQEVIRKGVAVEQEETAPQADGIHTFLSSRAPVFDENGQIYAIGGISTDITLRIRQEEELRQAQLRLQMIIDNLPGAIFWKDRNLNYQGCNFSFANFAGLASPEQIIGKHDYDLPWSDEEAASYQAYDRRVMEAGQPELNIIETQVTAEGKQIWVETNKIPLFDRDGQVVGILGTYNDITERKQTEQALRESQQLLKTIFDHLPVGMMLKDAAEGRYILWNKTAELHYGTRAEEVLGKTDYERLSQARADELQHQHQAIFARRTPLVEPEEEIESPQLGAMTVSVTRVPIFDQNDEPAYMLIITTDMSEQKRAADERATLQAQVIEAQQHALRELSTPLLPLSNKVVLMPIIGAIDSRRASQVMETLLQGVSDHNAEIAIVDITGVQVVDTQVANAFIQAARAVQLLGAQVLLTGIRPEVAQTLVQLGVDLQGMVSRGSLQAGVAYALKMAAAADR
jgi:rsbT co-antagonist protein RsbR